MSRFKVGDKVKVKKKFRRANIGLLVDVKKVYKIVRIDTDGAYLKHGQDNGHQAYLYYKELKKVKDK